MYCDFHVVNKRSLIIIKHVTKGQRNFNLFYTINIHTIMLLFYAPLLKYAPPVFKHTLSDPTKLNSPIIMCTIHHRMKSLLHFFKYLKKTYNSSFINTYILVIIWPIDYVTRGVVSLQRLKTLQQRQYNAKKRCY